MLKAKDIKHTEAYKQLRAAIELVVPEKDKRPAQLGLLVRRFLFAVNEQHPDWVEVRALESVDSMFTWCDTPEGYEFWSDICHARALPDLHPCPIGKHAPVVKKQVGWWV